MKNTSRIPVMNWNEYMPDSDFIIQTVDDNNIPARMKVPHRNNGYKVALLTEGSLSGYVDFEKIMAQAPAVLFSSPEQVMQLSSYSEHKMIHISFSKDYLVYDGRSTVLFEELLFGRAVIPISEEKESDTLKTYIRLMQREFTRLREQKDMIIRNLLNAFLVTITQLDIGNTHTTNINVSQHNILHRFRNLLEEHYASCTQVSDYADMIYITPGHLNDTIKTATGKTAKQLINERRMTEAKLRLYRDDLTVKEIALHLNFEDDAYFNRFFKKHTGQTPALFQKYTR